MSLYVLLTIQLESPQGVISPTSPSKKKKNSIVKQIITSRVETKIHEGAPNYNVITKDGPTKGRHWRAGGGGGG